jgi:hypothetical protein
LSEQHGHRNAERALVVRGQRRLVAQQPEHVRLQLGWVEPMRPTEANHIHATQR